MEQNKIDNLKLPAYPVTIPDGQRFSGLGIQDGFSKLELASLMIAQGLCVDSASPTRPYWLAEHSVEIAKLILSEANK